MNWRYRIQQSNCARHHQWWYKNETIICYLFQNWRIFLFFFYFKTKSIVLWEKNSWLNKNCFWFRWKTENAYYFHLQDNWGPLMFHPKCVLESIWKANSILTHIFDSESNLIFKNEEKFILKKRFFFHFLHKECYNVCMAVSYPK